MQDFKTNITSYYHYIRSQIAAGCINLVHIPSQFNTSDVQSKHYSDQQDWKNILQPFVHFHGDTNNLIIDDHWEVNITLILQQLLLLKNGDYQNITGIKD